MVYTRKMEIKSVLKLIAQKLDNDECFSLIEALKEQSFLLEFLNREENKDSVHKYFTRDSISNCLGDINVSDGKKPYDFFLECLRFSNKTYLYIIAKFVFRTMVLDEKRVNHPTSMAPQPFPYDDSSSDDNYLFWYRGQTKASYALLPSFYRNLQTPYNMVVNRESIIYYSNRNKRRLSDNYAKIFKDGSADIYEMFSFMQHSCSYSPFIDFTKKYLIALSFALSNYHDINSFNNDDSLIYKLTLTKKDQILTESIKINAALANHEIYYLKGKIVFGANPVFYKKSVNGDPAGKETKSFATYEEIIKLLTPKTLFIDLATNDRMKYQKGTFVFFYDFVLVKETILYNLNPDFYIEKFIIPKNSDKNQKQSQIDSIKKDHPEYEQRYLMNPYSYFRGD